MAVQKKINWMRLIIAIVLVAAGGYWIANNPLTFMNIMLVILGFGAVVVVHEFGHFIVAKLSGIKVEAFSIGFPPTLVAFTRKSDGYRLSILPKLFEVDEGDAGNKTDSPLAQVADPLAWDTEYRIGLIPFGGFVKMLGQEDTGAVQQTADPRSFTNKSIWIRVAVVAAGVIFNAILRPWWVRSCRALRPSDRACGPATRSSRSMARPLSISPRWSWPRLCRARVSPSTSRSSGRTAGSTQSMSSPKMRSCPTFPAARWASSRAKP